MGSRDDFRIAHRGYEPKAPASWTHSIRFATFRDPDDRATAFGMRGACSRFCRRFMEWGEEGGEMSPNLFVVILLLLRETYGQG